MRHDFHSSALRFLDRFQMTNSVVITVVFVFLFPREYDYAKYDDRAPDYQ